MTNQPFLILHKNRNKACFDIAYKAECCDGSGCCMCGEEPEQGFYWSLGTGGWRCWPYWYQALNEIELSGYPPSTVADLGIPMPEGQRDLFAINDKPIPSRKSELMELVSKLTPQPLITRRL